MFLFWLFLLTEAKTRRRTHSRHRSSGSWSTIETIITVVVCVVILLAGGIYYLVRYCMNGCHSEDYTSDEQEENGEIQEGDGGEDQQYNDNGELQEINQEGAANEENAYENQNENYSQPNAQMYGQPMQGNQMYAQPMPGNQMYAQPMPGGDSYYQQPVPSPY